MSDRIEKINELIRREIAADFLHRFTGKFISVSKTTVSRDLSLAKVWLSALDETDFVVRAAQAQAGEITTALARTLKLRRVPKLFFVADETAGKAERIEKLIEEIKSEKKK